MDKTTVYLPRELHQALEDIARRTGRPQAQLIREALTTYVADQETPRPKSAGIFSNAPFSSNEIDEWLEKNWEID